MQAMKNHSTFLRQHLRPAWRTILSGTCLAALLLAGLTSPAMAVESCYKSASIAKGLPCLITKSGPLDVSITLNTCTGTVGQCTGQGGGTCSVPATVTDGSLTGTLLRNGVPCYSPGTGTILARTSGWVSKVEKIRFNIPATFVAGTYTLTCAANVTFSADGSNPAQVYQVTGDTMVTMVRTETVPRLDVEAIDGASHTDAAGVIRPMRFRITNNDATCPATFVACLNSRQSAHLPRKVDGGGHAKTFSFGETIGHRPFPVLLLTCGQLPAFSKNSPKACTGQIKLGPNASTILYGFTKPLEGSSDGACSEYTFSVKGKFDDGQEIDATVGTTLTTIAHPGFWARLFKK